MYLVPGGVGLFRRLHDEVDSVHDIGQFFRAVAIGARVVVVVVVLDFFVTAVNMTHLLGVFIVTCFVC